MYVQEIPRIVTIRKNITNSNASSMLVLYSNNSEEIRQGYTIPWDSHVTVNSYLTNLRLTAIIKSLPEANFPQFELGESRQSKQMKALSMQWGSSRKQVGFYQGKEGDWSLLGACSLINPGGYPFVQIDLLNFLTSNLTDELGDGESYAIRLEDVGTGLLGTGDTLTIKGSIKEEIIVVAPSKVRNLVIE